MQTFEFGSQAAALFGTCRHFTAFAVEMTDSSGKSYHMLQPNRLRECDSSSISALVFCAVILCGSTGNLRAEPVAVPDPNLSAVIAKILERKGVEKENFDSEDLSEIRYLDAAEKGISDLTGLEYCTGLREVRLSKNSIASVEPLSECVEIQSLDLADNKLSNIAPLQSLTKLRYLRIENNVVESLECVAQMPLLRSVFAGRNRIADLSPLAELTNLHALYMGENRLSDLKPLEHLTKLSALDVRKNSISDLTPLQGLRRMRWTFLCDNKIESLETLTDMARLDPVGKFVPFWRVYIDGNPLDEAASEHVRTLRKAGVSVKTAETEKQ